MAFDGLKRFIVDAARRLPRIRYNAWTLGGRGADIFEKSAEALELERMNPLRGVDEWRLGQIFDDARDGIYADLAWLYNEIEGVEPALVACCDMRESAAAECAWLVRTADAERTRGFDKALADEQRAALLAELGAVSDDLSGLAEHLVSGFFRGAAHALPLWNEDGTLAGFRHLDLWNFALDRGTGLWWWNPDASRDEGTFEPVPPGTLVSLAATRHVDHAALPIFIRAALGAKRYGVWLDRFGIPPVAVVMPPNAEKGEQAAYMELARKFARGGNGILPNGSQVSYGTEARAMCPFADFIRFQQEQIYAVGIGRVQSGANDQANLGGNAAGVVEDGFRRIVLRDARRIARSVNDGVCRRILERLFPGRPALAEFAWDTERKRTGREVLEDAGLARNAGLAIDVGQLREMTGYRLEKDPSAAQPGGFGGFGGALNSQKARRGVAKPLQNAPRGAGATEVPPDASARSTALLRGFAADMGPAAGKIKSLLDELEAGRDVRDEARKLADELPDLMADDPAMAAVIEEAMAEAFAAGAGEGEAALNAKDANGMEHGEAGSGKGGQFVGKEDGGGSGAGKQAADTQARELGYRDRDDMMEQSKAVPSARISDITQGSKSQCKAHEAIAVLRANPEISDSEGRAIRFSDELVEHYVHGRRRKGNEPKVGSLRDLPLAIYAVRHDESPTLKFKQGAIRDPLDPPLGTQRVYRTPTGNGTLSAFAYVDSGRINGWHVK